MADHKVATHDGFIWPNPRHRMTDGDAIVERMVEDIADHHRRGGGPVCDLTDFRWTAAQCGRYGHVARSRYRNADDPIHRVRRPIGQPDARPLGPVPLTADMAALVEATRATDLAEDGPDVGSAA